MYNIYNKETGELLEKQITEQKLIDFANERFAETDNVDSFNKASFLPLSISSFGTEVTKTMLDDLGLSEAFSNPLFEVEEVK